MHATRAPKHSQFTTCAVRVQILESETELLWSDEFFPVFVEITGLEARELDHLLVPTMKPGKYQKFQKLTAKESITVT
ncbi:hypothetical protein L596_017481 [Steinernema carpocapsae]|uniref:Uncharacterized protein n=1 Tax=Steinernema carpocapsae TaxID=34508 RepID=A0A4U5N1T1_STECR|nr:hypothetical protein L596_017481 [Steinernema carpocapsae]